MATYYTEPGVPPLAEKGYCNRVAFYSDELEGFTGDISRASTYPTYGTVLRVIHFDLGDIEDVAGVITPGRIVALPSDRAVQGQYINLNTSSAFEGPVPEPMPFGVTAMNPSYFYPIQRDPEALEKYRAASQEGSNHD